MITLYHHGSSVCAAKVRVVLAEKALPWDGVYIDILRGDQFDPAYVARLSGLAVSPQRIETILRDLGFRIGQTVNKAAARIELVGRCHKGTGIQKYRGVAKPRGIRQQALQHVLTDFRPPIRRPNIDSLYFCRAFSQKADAAHAGQGAVALREIKNAPGRRFGANFVDDSGYVLG